jgi:hypothetical protein
MSAAGDPKQKAGHWLDRLFRSARRLLRSALVVRRPKKRVSYAELYAAARDRDAEEKSRCRLVDSPAWQEIKFGVQVEGPADRRRGPGLSGGIRT